MAAPAPSDTQLLEALRERGHEANSIEALPGDVSARRYFRVTLTAGRTALLAYYPPDLQPIFIRFERTTRMLERVAVPVPAILFTDSRAGLMLLQDLGAKTLYSRAHRSWRELTPFLEQAARLARSIAGLATAPVADLNPPLSRDLLAAELERTWKLLFAGETLAGDLPQRLRRALETMIDTLAAEPQVPCHRDFMARNLIPVGASPALAVIDHQDLRLGPAAYDLASLLNDSLFAPADVEDRLVKANLPEDQRLQYHRAAAQRTLKIVGTYLAFAELGDPRHLPLVAPSLASARRHLLELPECEAARKDVRSLWSEFAAAFPAGGPTRTNLLD